MISIVLCAGYATRMYPLTENFPKPLLPVWGSSILERLILDLDQIPGITRHVVVSNHKFIGHFEGWKKATDAKKPIALIDDGSTMNENRLGAVKDIALAIEKLHLNDDLLVAAGDNLLDFSLAALADSMKQHNASTIFCYHEPDPRVLRRCGVITPDENFRVLRMEEKPPEPATHWAVPPFYAYVQSDLPLMLSGIASGVNTDAPGSLPAWLCQRTPVYAAVMPGKRVDVGDLEGYERLRAGQTPV